MEASQVTATLLGERERFLAFLVGRLGSREAAEDLLQEAYLRTLSGSGDGVAPDKLLPWFFQMLRHAEIDRARARAAEGRAVDRLAQEQPDANPPPELAAELCRCIGGLLPTLKGVDQTLLRRVDLQDEGLATVARDMELTPNAAVVRLHRARKHLRQRLTQLCGACSTHGCLDCSCRPKKV